MCSFGACDFCSYLRKISNRLCLSIFRLSSTSFDRRLTPTKLINWVLLKHVLQSQLFLNQYRLLSQLAQILRSSWIQMYLRLWKRSLRNRTFISCQKCIVGSIFVHRIFRPRKFLKIFLLTRILQKSRLECEPFTNSAHSEMKVALRVNLFRDTLQTWQDRFVCCTFSNSNW